MERNDIGLREARMQLGDIANRADIAGEVTYLTRHNRPIAAVIPGPDNIVVVRTPDAGQAQRLRHIIETHGALGIPFPNNTTGWKVVDERDEPVNVHAIPSVEVEIVNVGVQYAYRIEISDDGERWDLYRDDARGVETTDADPEKLANLILTNHLADRRTNGEDLGETRVLLWKGDQEGLVEDALIVEANLMPEETQP